jgi:hypothetical protein
VICWHSTFIGQASTFTTAAMKSAGSGIYLFYSKPQQIAIIQNHLFKSFELALALEFEFLWDQLGL